MLAHLATITPPGHVQAPGWLTVLALASLAVAALCALAIVMDLLAGWRQHMWIMNVVWPVTALWSGPLGLWAYYRVGRLSSRRATQDARARGEDPPGKTKPFWQSVGVGATHCGAGCTLGDIVAESIMIVAPFALLGREVFGAWTLDFALALLLGIAFQYFTIKPMRDLSAGEGLKAAIKADFLSLTAWQVGMYGWMALVIFVLLGELSKTGPEFWFMMQVAMVVGFATSYPVNWWLLRRGIKETM